MRRYLALILCLLLPGVILAAESNAQLQLLIEQQQFAGAVRSGEKILQQNPQDTRARFLTAYAYQMSGNIDKATVMYQDLIRDNPALPEPRNNLAMIFLARGDYDEASHLLVEAINTHSSYATAYANLSQVYKGIASEAYRRAVSESSEPAKYTHDIHLTPITSLQGLVDEPAPMQTAAAAEAALAAPKAAVEPAAEAVPTVINTANRNTLLIENVRNWAKAWSNKDFDNYTAAYSADYSGKFDTHEKWVKHRFGRIMRPGTIKVTVGDFAVRLRDETRASVDFSQAFSSPGYSDRVLKRLDFKRVGSQWKIVSERVLSVL